MVTAGLNLRGVCDLVGVGSCGAVFAVDDLVLLHQIEDANEARQAMQLQICLHRDLHCVGSDRDSQMADFGRLGIRISTPQAFFDRNVECLAGCRVLPRVGGLRVRNPDR